MTPPLVFDRVWKRFRRGQAQASLGDVVPALVRHLIGRTGAAGKDDRDFWALRDLSFEVQPGEVLGIIGANGAGKSTVLKILNRIMDPTAGRVQAEGKVGALIEISAGFHQDLTGRQNIFLQGAIMGMRQAEVRRKFDEIVDFSGVGDFIDTPVKRYSNGMNARLGFSIAAHLEPDILIIDEVLAVGDAAFQSKAFARIKAMARAGAPVVLVSHQLDRIAELCTKAILLDHGAVRASGTPMHCIDEYLHGLGGRVGAVQNNQSGVTFTAIRAVSGLAVFSGGDLTVVANGRTDLDALPKTWTPAFRVVEASTETDVHSVTGYQRGIQLPTRGDFEYQLTFQMNLRPGKYKVEAFIWDAESSTHAVTGPHIQVEVLEGAPFYGGTQMNTRWKVLKSAAEPTTQAEPARRQSA
jgi:ABC-type polysaccharide/polyol phosphate transport system ATPase subunit